MELKKIGRQAHFLFRALEFLEVSVVEKRRKKRK